MSIVLSSSKPQVRIKTYGFLGQNGQEHLIIVHDDNPSVEAELPFDQFFELAAQLLWGHQCGNASNKSFRVRGDVISLDAGDGFVFDLSVLDFCYMITYVLMNTDLYPNDAREMFLASCRNLPKPTGASNLDAIIKACQNIKTVPGHNALFGDNKSTRYEVVL